MTDDERLDKAEQALNADGVRYPRPAVHVVLRIKRDRSYSAAEVAANPELAGKSRVPEGQAPQIDWAGMPFGTRPGDSMRVVRDQDNLEQNEPK